MHRRVVRAGALLFLGALALWASVGLAGSVPSGLRVGEPAPDPELPRLGGGTLRLSQFRGTPVLLRISSRACSSCSNDFELLQRFQDRYDRRLQVVALETGSPSRAVEEAVAGRVLSYPVAIDSDGSLAAAWPLRRFPAFFLLDRTGRLRDAVWGDASEGDLDRMVAPLLSPPPAPGSERFQELFRQVATQIRCQECEGLSVWESNAASARISRVEIEERLAQGWTRDEIVRWFEDRYGVWILMTPPPRGGLTWVWIAPALILLAGAGLVARYVRRPAPPEEPNAERLPAELAGEVERRLREYL